jgi:hypothetical protein
MPRQSGCIGQVENVLAVHLIGAQGHRLRLERERLLSLKPSGFEPPRGIERRHADRIEAATGDGSPLT